ncbi:protein kinase C delta type-like isoform X2 [Brachyhypopomus gauderio]|uniref:protein kinase C delta type-like isoform X2 n=1 Tax=Brachyhypopomus gauderio TaxID=698409 RepID=UPI0040433A3C
MRVYKYHVQYNFISVRVKMMSWKDIKRRCLWCWCCGGTQEDSDTEEEPRRERIKKKKRKNKRAPKQETDNTHRLTPLNKSAVDEACVELLQDPRDEIGNSCSRPLETPVSKCALDEACEEHINNVLDDIEDSRSRPLGLTPVDEACEDLHALPDETEESDNPPLDASQCGPLCEGSSPRPLSEISHQKRITLEHFTFHKVLGKGGYGKVFLAELKGREEWFAVKAMKKDVLINDDVENTMVEKRVLSLGWDCPFLTHLYCTFQTKEHLFFVMEYVNGGELYFHKQKKERLDLNRATFYAAEIVCGLQFLHGKGVIHRDLKLDNVLLDGEGHVKITDFGLCKENVFGDNLTKTFCGTPEYTAPEILLEQQYSFSVDWWSFGVLVYGMLVGVLPFDGDDKEELYEAILNDTPVFPPWINMDTRNMLKGLFERDPAQRLGVVSNIRGHSFFKTVDWTALERREIEPPYKPNVTSHNDCSNFDQGILSEEPLLSQCEEGSLDSMDQTAFAGFSFINPRMEPLLQQ